MDSTNLQEYIEAYGEKFIVDNEKYVLKNINEVLFRKGDKVVYRDYIFYFDYGNGDATSKIYATYKDYIRKSHAFNIKTYKLQKIVPIEKLDEEHKLYKEMVEYWKQNYNGYYSDDSDNENNSYDSDNENNSYSENNSYDSDNESNSYDSDNEKDLDNSNDTISNIIKILFISLVIFYFF